jgi:hypothetical protein
VSDDYLWDRSGPRDPEVLRLERVLGTLGQQQPPAPLSLPPGAPVRSRPLSFVVACLVAAAAVVMLVGFTWLNRVDTATGWEVTRVSGTPTIASRPVDDRAELKVGRWLETKNQGRATIAVAHIGQVEVEPDSRLSLLSTRPGDYRLQLQRGTMHALIWAPPGQFFVQTPSSTAVDLGCAYTMSVDDGGVGIVRVTSGWVGFEWQGREAFIPAGAMSITRPGLGPGTPHYEDTSDAFRAALTMIDTKGGSAAQRASALDHVLSEATDRDRVTLWHLLTRVDVEQRDRVFDRLSQLTPAPPGVTRDGIRAGRRDMLDQWWDTLGLGTTNWWRTWKQPWRDSPSR